MPRTDRPTVAEDYLIAEDGCWEWQGRIDRNGYGKAYDPEMPSGQRVDWAHRVSFRRHRGPIPEGHELDHLCENKPCINPDHLDPVTRSEHVRRTIARAGGYDRQIDAAQLRALGLTYQEIADALQLAGRTSAHHKVQAAIANGLVDPTAVPPARRLSGEDREDIRDLYSLGIPQAEIAAWFGIDNSQVSRVCNYKTSRKEGVA